MLTSSSLISDGFLTQKQIKITTQMYQIVFSFSFNEFKTNIE